MIKLKDVKDLNEMGGKSPKQFINGKTNSCYTTEPI